MTALLETEVSEKLYTVEEFLKLEWPDDDDNEYELIGGRIVARGSTSGKHGEIVFRLSSFLGNYLQTNPIGRGFVEASCFLGQLEGINYVKPDVCFVQAERIPAKFRGPIPVAPDLVVEVWSPSDSTEIIQDKIEAYQAAGVKLIWSVYILHKFVIVHQLGQERRAFLELDDELDGQDVLPGFKLKVNTLFE